MTIKNPLIDYEVLHVAREMVELGARTSIVVAVTGLSATKARAMYRARYGAPQKTGNMTTLARSFVASPEHALHTTLLCSVHRWLTVFDKRGHVDNLLGAFKLYKRICTHQCGDPVFDLNDAYQMIRLLRTEQLRFKDCHRCRCEFVVASDQWLSEPLPLGTYLCPACQLRANAYCECERVGPVNDRRRLCRVCKLPNNPSPGVVQSKPRVRNGNVAQGIVRRSDTAFHRDPIAGRSPAMHTAATCDVL